MTTEQSDPRKTIKPLNAHMKIGLITGAIFITVSQVILFVVFPMNPPNTDVWLNVGATANLMTISSVIVLVIGIIERRLGKRR